ncbi:hypothetical protein ACCQ10_09065 [Xanthomonas sp. NCPPB 1325]|uniref:hypothetical protein n=1 Tax=Xanthomonas sp. NCPPB 1325 TaxID=487529 RepID=UPI0035591E4F
MAIAQRRVRGALTRLLAGGFIEERNQRTRHLLVTSLKNGISAADSLPAVLLKALRTDQLDWSLPAHRRGTLSGMDAAPEPYLFGMWQRRCREPAWAAV